MNNADLPDLENRIRGLFQTKYKNQVDLTLRVNVYWSDEDTITIEFVYNVHEDPRGPTFVYDIPRRKLHISDHGEVLFESRRLSRSRESPHLINTLDMSANQRAALTDKIQRECNRVFYGRSRGGATRRKRRRTTRQKTKN
jgi:hypothetical protein